MSDFKPGNLDFVDTTLRDGPHSLWAQKVTTPMMLPVCETLDEAGFRALEVMGSGNFKKCIRDLKEDPWRKIDALAARIRRTRMAFVMLPSVTTFDITPPAVLRLYVERLAAHGMRRMHLMESANDMGNRIPEMIDTMRQVGMESVIALVYSISPKHSDEYYARKAGEAAALKPDVIYLKDPAGLLTPERTRTVVPAILSRAGAVPVEIHSHCTTGLAPLCYLEAIKLGIKVVHTGIPPLANGAAQPSVFNIAKNAALLGFQPTVKLDRLPEVSAHFNAIAKREGYSVGAPLEYDVSQYLHHVPGGVISHLRHQITQLGMGERLPEVLEEVARVRVEFGYPIMVTPFSQFVASQAALNVMLGERYRQVSDEVIQFALGWWGAEAAEGMESGVKQKILDSARAKEIAAKRPSVPTLAEVRERLGGAGLSDDELLLRFISPEGEIAAMRAAGEPKPYSATRNSLLELVKELAKRKDLRAIHVRSGETSITLRGRVVG